MFQPRNPINKSSIRIAFLLLLSLLIACRNDANKSEKEIQPTGEPENYSATVVRTIDDGTKRETTISVEARSGEQRREEWTEGGHARALILQAADGKSFLLDLESRTYVEVDAGSEITASSQSVGATPEHFRAGQNNDAQAVPDFTALGVDHYFDDSQPPTRLETRSLPDKVVDGHNCVVFEVRATYEDGHTETTRRFIATDLSRLPLRVECESDQSNIKMITERRNVSIDVSGDLFVVPADFKKVNRLQK